MSCSAIDKAFVRKWAGHYPPRADNHVLGEIHRRVQDRKFYTVTDAEAVVVWKSNRTITEFRRNTEADIEEVTKLALAGPERLAHRVLRLLRGVGNPVASAFLTVFDPTKFTVIDVRAIRTLQQNCEVQIASDPAYREYVDLCRRIADRCETDLRTLDRALWAWDKANPT